MRFQKVATVADRKENSQEKNGGETMKRLLGLMLAALGAIMLLIAPALAQEADLFTGDWLLVSGTANGVELSDLSQLDVSIQMHLNADGTGTQSIDDDTYTCTWTFSGENVIAIDDGVVVMACTLMKDGSLVCEDGSGDKLVFARSLPGASVAGVWTLTAAVSEGIRFDDMAALDASLSLDLQEDGTGTIASATEQAPCTWIQAGTTVTVVQQGGFSSTFYLQEDGTLATDTSGVTLILSRDESALSSNLFDSLANLLTPKETQAPEETQSPATQEALVSDFGYSIVLPEGWFPFNSDTLAQMIDMLGPETAAQYGLTQSQLDSFIALEGTLYYSPDLSGNCNIIREKANGITMDDFPLLASSYESAYQSIGITDFALSGPVEFQGRVYYVGNYTSPIEGVEQSQCFSIANDYLYTITFTNVTQSDMEQLLGGFSPI